MSNSQQISILDEEKEMSYSQKINASIRGTEYTFYVEYTRDFTSEPCGRCTAESEDSAFGDNAVHEYTITSMLDECGNEVDSSHRDFKTALLRLHQQAMNNKPICLDCYSKLDISIASD